MSPRERPTDAAPEWLIYALIALLVIGYIAAVAVITSGNRMQEAPRPAATNPALRGQP